MHRRIIILGHSGFIGRQLERHLLKSGDGEVVGRSLSDIDLTDSRSAADLASLFNLQTILVLAAAVKRQFGDTLDAFRKNMAIVENVCHALKTNPVRRVIFLSSAAVYGEEAENLSINEQTAVSPTSFYGIAKYGGERLLIKTCADSEKTSLVSLRPPLVYGPGDESNTYGPVGFCAAAMAGRPITLWGDGTELREFIFINDLCHLIGLLIESEFSGELNVVSGTRHCFADIVSILKGKFPSLEVTSRPRTRPKANNAFDAKRLKALVPPDYQFTSLANGLSQLLDHESIRKS